MIISHTPGALKRFGRTSWRFQKTFGTPLKELDDFVSTILSCEPRIAEGCLTMDQVVFEPKNLIALLSRQAQPPMYGHDWSYAASGREQVQELLCAAFSDWTDFLFVPSPKPFVIYADHDEFTTFFANTKSNLNKVVSALLRKNFQEIPNWQRSF